MQILHPSFKCSETEFGKVLRTVFRFVFAPRQRNSSSQKLRFTVKMLNRSQFFLNIRFEINEDTS